MSHFLESDRIYLRELRPEDADGDYLIWLNDVEVCAGNSHHVYPYSLKKALEYIGNCEGLVLAICMKRTFDGQSPSSLHIGNISLTGVHPINRVAQFAILIGNRNAWAKGYGKEAGGLLIKHGFEALNLNKIECGTFSTNVGMQKLAASLGFKEEGRRRQSAWKSGEYVDVIEYGLLRDER